MLSSALRSTKRSLHFPIFLLNFYVYASSLPRIMVFLNFPNLKHRWECSTVKTSAKRCGRRSSLLCRCPSRSGFFVMHPSRAWAVQRMFCTCVIWKCVCVRIEVYFSQWVRYVIVYCFIWVIYSTIQRCRRPNYIFIYLIQRHTTLHACMLKSAWNFKFSRNWFIWVTSSHAYESFAYICDKWYISS
jgi:hypothetical protein